MIERRGEARRRTLLSGRLSFNHRQSVLDCEVRNVSSVGALVVFPEKTLAPGEFELHISAWDKSFNAGVVWRDRERAGVTLSSLPDPISLAKVRRLRTLERENRDLKS